MLCIQLFRNPSPSDDVAIVRNFGKMMEQGKLRNAIQYLSSHGDFGLARSAQLFFN